MENLRHLEAQPVLWDEGLRSQMLGYPQVLAMFHLCIPWTWRYSAVKWFFGQVSSRITFELALRDGGYTSTDPEEFDYEGKLFIFKNSLFFKPIKWQNFDFICFSVLEVKLRVLCMLSNCSIPQLEKSHLGTSLKNKSKQMLMFS